VQHPARRGGPHVSCEEGKHFKNRGTQIELKEKGGACLKKQLSSEVIDGKKGELGGTGRKGEGGKNVREGKED